MFSLKRISTVGPKCGGGGGVIGYLRPDQFLDHLTVIKIVILIDLFYPIIILIDIL